MAFFRRARTHSFQLLAAVPPDPCPPFVCFVSLFCDARRHELASPWCVPVQSQSCAHSLLAHVCPTESLASQASRAEPCQDCQAHWHPSAARSPEAPQGIPFPFSLFKSDILPPTLSCLLKGPRLSLLTSSFCFHTKATLANIPARALAHFSRQLNRTEGRLVLPCHVVMFFVRCTVRHAVNGRAGLANRAVFFFFFFVVVVFLPNSAHSASPVGGLTLHGTASSSGVRLRRADVISQTALQHFLLSRSENSIPAKAAATP